MPIPQYLYFILSFIFILTTTTPTIAKEHYINGIDANYPPFSFINEHGKPSGFDIESMDWIANTMGFTIKHKPIAWDGIIPALLAKKIDMICSGLSVSPERAEVVLFTTPYWTTEKVLVVKQDSKLSLDDFYNKKIRVGVQRGTNEAEKLQADLQQKKYKYDLRLYDFAALAIEDLLNGRIQAVVMDGTIANDAIRHKKTLKKIGAIEKKDIFAVALRKEETDLAKTIEKGYELLQKDHFWKELQKKYFE